MPEVGESRDRPVSIQELTGVHSASHGSLAEATLLRPDAKSPSSR